MDALPKLVQTRKGSSRTETSDKLYGWRKHYHDSLLVCGLCPLISPRLDWFQISTRSCSKRLCSSATANNISCAFAWSQDSKPILWKSSMKDFLIAVSSRGETHERKIEPAFTMWQDHWPQGYLQLGCWNFSGGGGNSNIFGNVHPENLGKNMIQFDLFFQMGWNNHHLELLLNWWLVWEFWAFWAS